MVVKGVTFVRVAIVVGVTIALVNLPVSSLLSFLGLEGMVCAVLVGT